MIILKRLFSKREKLRFESNVKPETNKIKKTAYKTYNSNITIESKHIESLGTIKEQ
ncbi:MAG: hypothetical protein HQ541_19450 [Mariniphaga sp.]|nr:hypothetical protein [Mariniphaga sp.]